MKFFLQLIAPFLTLLGGWQLIQTYGWAEDSALLSLILWFNVIFCFIVVQVAVMLKPMQLSVKGAVLHPARKEQFDQLVVQFKEVGFKTGPLLKANNPEATIRSLLHSDGVTGGTVALFKGTILWELVSSASGELTLTTAGNKQMGFAPRPAHAHLQVLPDNSPAEALANHQRALEHLRSQGEVFRELHLKDYIAEAEEASYREMLWAKQNLLRYIFTVCWRLATRNNPYLGKKVS